MGRRPPQIIPILPSFCLEKYFIFQEVSNFWFSRGVVRKLLLGLENYIFQARGWYLKIQDWLQKKESYQRRLRGSVSSSPMVLLSELPFPDIMESWCAPVQGPGSLIWGNYMPLLRTPCDCQ